MNIPNLIGPINKNNYKKLSDKKLWELIKKDLKFLSNLNKPKVIYKLFYFLDFEDKNVYYRIIKNIEKMNPIVYVPYIPMTINYVNEIKKEIGE